MLGERAFCVRLDPTTFGARVSPPAPAFSQESDPNPLTVGSAVCWCSVGNSRKTHRCDYVTDRDHQPRL